MLAAPAAALHWLVHLAGIGPTALTAAETGISWAALQRLQAHITLMRNLVAALYLTLAAAVCAIAAASRHVRKDIAPLPASR